MDKWLVNSCLKLMSKENYKPWWCLALLNARKSRSGDFYQAPIFIRVQVVLLSYCLLCSSLSEAIYPIINLYSKSKFQMNTFGKIGMVLCWVTRMKFRNYDGLHQITFIKSSEFFICQYVAMLQVNNYF